MATRFIDKESTSAALRDLPDAGGIGIVSGALLYHDGNAAVAVGSGAPVSLTAGATLSPGSHANRALVVDNAAGAAIVLPAATGTGHKYRVLIGTALATGDVTVTAAGADTYQGYAIVEDSGDSSPTDAVLFPASGGTIFTFDQSAGSGAVGDWVELEDFKTGVWSVKGYVSAQGDAATPFS